MEEPAGERGAEPRRVREDLLTDPDRRTQYRPVEELSRSDRFRVIFEEELDYVCRSLRRLGVRPSEVEDVAQEVFVRVFGKLDTYDGVHSLRSWIFGFAHKVAANHTRLARFRHEDLGADETAGVEHGTPEARAIAAEARKLVLHCLEQVPQPRRSVLIMHDLDGATASEIAASLELPLNTVYSRLRTARGEFRDAHRRLTARHSPSEAGGV